MPDLRKYRIDVGWSNSRLASEAGITRQAVKQAEEGRPVHAETAKAIADALSRVLGKELKVSEIDGLNVL